MSFKDLLAKTYAKRLEWREGEREKDGEAFFFSPFLRKGEGSGQNKVLPLLLLLASLCLRVVDFEIGERGKREANKGPEKRESFAVSFLPLPLQQGEKGESKFEPIYRAAGLPFSINLIRTQSCVKHLLIYS